MLSGQRSPAIEGRLYFLDHLRASVILLVIVLHASITYMVSPPTWWYVIELKTSILFTALVLVLDVPIMLILFFIAGFFAYPSLERHGAGRSMRQKLVRIGLPWIFGVVFLTPLVAYLIPVTRGDAKPYLEFWTTDFWGPYYQQSVYWFLGILLLLFGLLAALYSGEPNMRGVPRQTHSPAWTLFAKFLVMTTVWYFVTTFIVPPDYWSNALKLFVFQPTRLLLYAAYFGLGVLADRRGWLRGDGYYPGLGRWGAATLVSAVLYTGLKLNWPEDANIMLSVAALAVLFNVYCLSALLFSLAFFQCFANRPTRLWSSLARNAYAIYYAHPLILYPTAYAALSVQASIFLEAIFLIVFTIVVAWGLGILVLTRWPLLRDAF